jgi:CRISPR-associated endonuclease Cas1
MDRSEANAPTMAVAEQDDPLELTFARDAENPSVCVVDGHGVKIQTRSGRLVVSDGIGRHRRERIYNRATHGLSRLVIVASTGHITLDANRWLEGAEVGLVILDPASGAVISASTRVANDDSRLRRSQALSMATETGLEVSKYLISLKLAGQASVAAQELSAPETSKTITGLSGRVDDSSTLEEVRQVEALAANQYWAAWENVRPLFVKRDRIRVPDNWLVFEGRRSAFTPGTARNATDVTNCLLNYSYRMLEAEAHLATLAVGLDPGLGVLHADLKGRPNFVLDLLEAARPLAERHLLRLLSHQPLRWRDFHEDRNGVVRVLPPLSHRLAEATPGFASTLAPVAERVARMLADASPYDIRLPSVLTKEKHRAAARRRADGASPGQPVGPGAKSLTPRGKRRRRPVVELEPALPLPICRGCGAILQSEPDRKRRRGAYCPQCLAVRRRELGATLPTTSRDHAQAFASCNGGLPTHSPAAQKRRSQANAARRSEQSAWDASHGGQEADAQWFKSAILPGLAKLPLSAIAETTGMSTSSASKVRAGRRTPHPRHWAALADLIEVKP